ncbi:DUF4153 domain-containing protein [Schnuerera sp. xch1]|uniref:DUF4153 domain-containing protein n=1 Tax=Schnuerera sp. xch1 TaxID=2874283 RepID=UPI001CBBA23F|nr:DUF4153 domain-containing protein [Schnuerera sp. xch1]MBZ2174427.1 DUF4153 domain-containing protein [Schnuerera sp. xch1]
MSISIRLQDMLKNIRKSFERFPVTIAISSSLVIMLIILSEKGPTLSSNVREIIERVCMIIALGIPLSVCLKLIFERKKITNRVHRIIGYIIGAIILILYYFILLNEFNLINNVRYIGVSIFLYLAFSYIPWINKKEGYEHYIIELLSSFFLTIIYSFVLFLGISAIFFTIDQLFNANITGKYFYYTFLVIAGVFAISLFLARIPEIDKDFYEKKYPKALKVLLLYIVIPLITVYSIILYVYFFRIIITRNWPQGLVSHLVLWYSVVSIIVIFFLTPILDSNKWANRFKSLFPKFIIPILIMMFVAIGIRINAYGITENRYFGLILGIWVLGIMIYFSFKKNLKNIIIPTSLSIIALVSVFGPLSSFSISKFSQNNRLESILVENEMLEDNEIVASKGSIDQEDKEEISMILNYFENNHSLEDVKYIPNDFKIDDMEEVFGFPYTEKNMYANNYFYYYVEPRAKSVVDVNEYDYFIDGFGLNEGSIKIDDLNISYNNNDNTVIIKETNEILHEVSIGTYVDNILDNINEEANNRNLLNPEDTIFINENDKVRVKIIINGFSGRRDYNANKNLIKSIEYYMLIEIK